MKKLVSLLAIAVATVLAGCRGQRVSSNAQISVEDVPSYAPEMQRKYTAKVGNWVTVEINAEYRPILKEVLYTGTLTQLGGAKVYFDPDNIADRIVDRNLVPQVVAVTIQALYQDKEFRKSTPSEYTDSDGHTWKRVK